MRGGRPRAETTVDDALTRSTEGRTATKGGRDAGSRDAAGAVGRIPPGLVRRDLAGGVGPGAIRRDRGALPVDRPRPGGPPRPLAPGDPQAGDAPSGPVGVVVHLGGGPGGRGRRGPRGRARPARGHVRPDPPGRGGRAHDSGRETPSRPRTTSRNPGPLAGLVAGAADGLARRIDRDHPGPGPARGPIPAAPRSGDRGPFVALRGVRGSRTPARGPGPTDPGRPRPGDPPTLVPGPAPAPGPVGIAQDPGIRPMAVDRRPRAGTPPARGSLGPPLGAGRGPCLVVEPGLLARPPPAGLRGRTRLRRLGGLGPARGAIFLCRIPDPGSVQTCPGPTPRRPHWASPARADPSRGD